MILKSINVFVSILLLLPILIKSDNSTVTNITTTTLTTTTTTTSPPTSSAANVAKSGCNLSKSSAHETSLLERLKPLQGDQFFWNDTEHEYYFSVCGKATNANLDNEGFIQINPSQKKTWVIGRLDDVDLEGIDGSVTFLRLLYNNGDKYARACNGLSRTSIIYITCSETNEFKMIEENNDRDNGNCGYVFQLLTPKICLENSNTSPNTPTNDQTNKLGFFSIAIISILSLMCAYIIFGSLYLRFVRNERGWAQIPNRRLWQYVGKRSIDCCNIVCRCGKKPSEIHSYDNINDRMSDDENLLNF